MNENIIEVYDYNGKKMKINVIKYFTLKENMKDYIFYKLYSHVSSNTVLVAEVDEKEDSIYLKDVENNSIKNQLKSVLENISKGDR